MPSMLYPRSTFRRIALCAASLWLAPAFAASSYDGQRWFQIEISVFSHEGPDRNYENWSPARLDLGYPDNIRDFQNFFDRLLIEDFEERVLGIADAELLATEDDSARAETADALLERGEALPFTLTTATVIDEAVNDVGPFPPPAQSAYKFFDSPREAFLQLPAELSDFQQTNRALSRSGDTRLLYHGLWRQPVVRENRAQPLYVQGGDVIDGQHELQGSLTLRFNEGQDRVVLDANLWLLEFGPVSSSLSEWSDVEIPESSSAGAARARALATGLENGSALSRVFQLKQSRDMRSDEFHYIDHPALGIVIMVNPYDLPIPGSSIDEQLEDLPPAC